MASGNKVVVIILSIVGGILFLSCGACGTVGFFVWRGVSAIRQTAECKNNLRQIVLGIQNHHDQRGDLPPLYIADPQGKPLLSWRVLLLPYIEQQNMWRQIHMNEPWDSKHNRQFHSQMPPIYVCPSSPHPPESGLTSYFAISGEGGALQPLIPETTNDATIRRLPSPTSIASIHDGLSNTAFVFEATGYSVNWMQPVDIKFDELQISKEEGQKGLGSSHPGGIIHLGMGDGRVFAVSKDTPLEDLRGVLNRNDGKYLDEQWIAH